MMLQEVSLSNFKCFEHVTLNCRPLNLLCGLNGMGKSSVIQALLVLRQSFQSGRLQEGKLVLGGALVELGAGIDVLFEDAVEEEIGFAIRAAGIADQWHQVFRYSTSQDYLSVTKSSAGIPDWLVDIPPLGGQLVYVQAERLGPQKMYPLSEMKAESGEFGVQGELAWNLLNSRQRYRMGMNDPRCVNCVDAPRYRLDKVVDHWLQDVSPGAHLEMRTIPDASAITAGFRFDRKGDVQTRRYRSTNVGFGLSYVMPVILALLSPQGTLCLIENPEAHLHPRGQTRLAELAVRAAQAGVQVMVETHSDHFLDGVRIAVREGVISPSDTSIHYFEHDKDRTVVSSPKLDSDGRLDRWPNGFFDQHEDNLARLLAPRK